CLGMEGPQSVGASELEMAEAPVRVGLEQERVDDVTPSPHDLTPAPPLAAFSDRPGQDRPVLRAPPPPRGAGRPGHRPTAGVAEVASISSSVAAVQRAAAASSSPASGGETRPTTRTSRSPYSSSIVPRSRTRAKSSPAAYGRQTSTSTHIEASRA